MDINPYFNQLNVAVFDIETTGLVPYRDHLILGGIYSFAENSIMQFFCEHPSSEHETLKQISSALTGYDAIITYNGNTFDFPFLMKRAQENKICFPELIYQTVDLYKWLRLYWPQAKKMESMRQKNIEDALGFAEKRTDTINGSDCINLYNNYLQEADVKAKDAILLHNRDDILQLKRIAEALTFLPYNKIAYEQGFVVKADQNKMLVLKVALKNTMLTATGAASKNMKSASIFKEAYSFEYDADTGVFSLSLNCREDEGLVYADIREIPVNASNYLELSGFFHSFLILKDGPKFFYYEINRLVHELLNHILTEDLQ